MMWTRLDFASELNPNTGICNCIQSLKCQILNPCVESAAMGDWAHWAPATHHRSVVRTCHWCAETEFPRVSNLHSARTIWYSSNWIGPDGYIRAPGGAIKWEQHTSLSISTQKLPGSTKMVKWSEAPFTFLSGQLLYEFLKILPLFLI